MWQEMERNLKKKKNSYRVSQPTLRISHRKHQIHSGRLWSCSSCYKWSFAKSDIKTKMSPSFNLGNQIFLSSHGLENIALDVHLNCKKIKKILHTFSPDTNCVGWKEWVISLPVEVCLGMRWGIPYSSRCMGRKRATIFYLNPWQRTARHTKSHK